MQRGGMSAGCFVAYTAQGAVTAQAHAQVQQECLAMLDAINTMQGTHNGVTAVVCSRVADIRAAHAKGVIAVIPAVKMAMVWGMTRPCWTRLHNAGRGMSH